MKKGKEIMLTDSMEGFQEKAINYNDYEVSFRRWLVIQIDSGNMSHQEARERFSLSIWDYKKIIKRWQERYSDEIHLSCKLWVQNKVQMLKRWRNASGSLKSSWNGRR